MQNRGGEGQSGVNKVESSGKVPAVFYYCDWPSFADDEDIMEQRNKINAMEEEEIPYVGEKEALSPLAAEYQSGSPILLQKIKILEEQYAAIRRTRGDGNCFFRAFMFLYLEHILETQDRAEVDRIKSNIEECRRTLQSLGYVDFTFEDFFLSIP